MQHDGVVRVNNVSDHAHNTCGRGEEKQWRRTLARASYGCRTPLSSIYRVMWTAAASTLTKQRASKVPTVCARDLTYKVLVVCHAVAVMCLQSVYGLDLQDQACAAKYGSSINLQVVGECNLDVY